MTDRDDDARLAAALRTALKERDRVVRPPRFAKVWPNRTEDSRTAFAWRPLIASAAAAVVIAGVMWTWRTDSPVHIDPVLAHQLSSADYWRVPTDEVLAFEPAPLDADLPSPTGVEFSLEESLL
jgi:hypothetical protein